MDLIDEYTANDVNWFVTNLIKQVQAKEITDKMDLVNSIIIANGTQTKKGNVYYQKWIREQREEIEKLNTDETVFQKLKNSVSNNTVFTKLKKFSGS